MPKLFLLQVLFLVSGILHAQTITTFREPFYVDPERDAKVKRLAPMLEQWYRDHARLHHFPGYAFGVVLDGRLILSGSGGYSNLAEKTAATPATLFRIASMSKSFTTCAILQLRDQGRLTLDDPLTMYIPAMKGMKLTEDGPDLTLRHCMNHLAGFPEDNPWGDRQLADTEEELLEMVRQGISFSNTPGIHYEYSNLGFALLGFVIRKVTGLSYDAYIRKEILLPLGMAETVYEYRQVPPEKLARGYRYREGKWEVEPLLADGIYGAMGGMISSVEQFSRYLAFHAQAWPERNGPDEQPLRRSTLREMHTPQAFIGLNTAFALPTGKRLTVSTAYAYGLNWMRDQEGRTSVGHSGGLPGFGSNWRFLPEYGLGVIFLANATYAPTSSLNVAVLDTLVKLAGLAPRAVPVSPVLAQRQAQLLACLPSWENLEVDVFAENFFPDYPLSDLKRESSTLFAKVGKILHVSPMQPENQLRGHCLLTGERGILKLRFTLSPEIPARIQEYHLTEVPTR